MNNSIRFGRVTASGVNSLPESAKAGTASTKATSATAPNAPATNLRAAAAPRASRMEDESSSANLASSLGHLTRAQKAFGKGFDCVNMSEREAIALSHAALKACNAQLNSVEPRLHGMMPAQAFVDQLGQKHVRLNRCYDGIPIFGEQAIAHFSAKGEIIDITAQALPATLNISTKPSISVKEAEDLVTQAAMLQGAGIRSAKAHLVIDKTSDDVFHLCYVVEVETDKGESGNIFIDANSGEAIESLSFMKARGFVPDFKAKQASNYPPAPKHGKGFVGEHVLEAGEGNSLYSGVVKLSTEKSGEIYNLRDPVTHSETRDAHNGEGGTDSSNTVYTDSDNKWANTDDPEGAKAAVDAQFNAQQVELYLKEMYDRNSLDGKGMPLLSNVHVNYAYDNAYWDGDTMNCGDGDGQMCGPLVDPDVVAHEEMHGNTQHTSGLLYRGESGWWNEALSDILGSVGISWFIDGRGESKPEYWTIGEKCWTPGIPGDALRYMDHPTKDREPNSGEMYSRDNYKSRYTGSQDNGGVHLNSGIANNFAYLLAMGGTNDTSKITVEHGVGIEKMLRIIWRANLVYFTPNLTFAQARDAMLKAAADLYGEGGDEQKTVAQAMLAVGIENGAKKASEGSQLLAA